MFVEELSIEEFRGVRECEEPIKLSKLTVLVGRNNSGKTAVLEALSLLPGPYLAFPAYGVRRVDFVASMHGGYESLVYGYSGRAKLKYAVRSVDSHVWYFELDTTSSITPLIIDEKEATLPDMGKALGVVGDDYTVRRVLSEMVFFIPNDTTALAKLHDALREEEKEKGHYREYRNRMVKSGANVRVVRELMNRCVDDFYTEMLLHGPEPAARKELPDGRVFYIKLKDLGDGVEKAVLTALWLEALKPSLVLWDDFEVSAHPSLVRELLAWLSEHDWQVVLATHSIDVLYRLVEARPDGAQAVLLQRSADDVLRAGYMSLDELEEFLEAGQDPRYLVEVLKL